MSDLLLSICITTFNRDKFLDELLTSIPDSYVDRIEVCVNDNANHDNTPQVIERHRPRFPNFRHMRRERVYEFDDNLLNVVSLATGKYCWTIGDDDQLTTDALDVLFDVLENERPSILIVNPILISIDKAWKKTQHWLPADIPSFHFRFDEADKIKRYYDLAQGISAIGGFISTNVFDRKLWLNTAIDRQIASHFVHLNKLTAMLYANVEERRSFIYLNKHIVYATVENTAVNQFNFSVKKRMFLDFNTITAVADAYIKDPALRQSFVHILRRQHPFGGLFRTLVVPETDAQEYQLLTRIFPAWQLFACRHFCYRRHGVVHRSLKLGKLGLSDLPGVARRLKSFLWRVCGYNVFRSIVHHAPYWAKTRIDFLALLAPPNIDVDFNYNGLLFRAPAEALYLIPELATNGYARFIRGCGRVLDLGGYIGESALALSQCNREVWVYEPELRKFDIILRHVNINGKQGAVKAFRQAVVGDGRASASIAANGVFDGSASLAESGGQPVPCVSIEAVLDQASFDGLKMDIEGGEYEIFAYFLARPERFQFARGVVELHFNGMSEGRAKILDETIALLNARGLEPSFYLRPSRQKTFAAFAEIREWTDSPYVMMRFGKK